MLFKISAINSLMSAFQDLGVLLFAMCECF
jgi:hypothetical protein